MTIAAPLNIHATAVTQSKVWSTDPQVRFNEQDLTVMRLEGQFPWHAHPDSDEMFYVLDGEVFVETREGSTDIAENTECETTSRWLRKGDVFVVPQNTAHRSAAPTGASVMFGLRRDALLFMKDMEKAPVDMSGIQVQEW